MSEQRPPSSLTQSAVTEVGGMVRKLDPNMTAVLLLTVILNGLFFYTYVHIADSRHIEFMAALNSCPIQPGRIAP